MIWSCWHSGPLPFRRHTVPKHFTQSTANSWQKQNDTKGRASCYEGNSMQLQFVTDEFTVSSNLIEFPKTYPWWQLPFSSTHHTSNVLASAFSSGILRPSRDPFGPFLTQCPAGHYPHRGPCCVHLCKKESKWEILIQIPQEEHFKWEQRPLNSHNDQNEIGQV